MMLSKEEIEEAKEELNKFCEYDDNLFLQDEILYEYQDAIEILLLYIEQLEKYLERISKQLDNVALDQIPIGIEELQQKLEKKVEEK